MHHQASVVKNQTNKIRKTFENRLRHGLPQEMRETDWKSLRIESKACGGSLAVPQER